jgi:hypothetical protein
MSRMPQNVITDKHVAVCMRVCVGRTLRWLMSWLPLVQQEDNI